MVQLLRRRNERKGGVEQTELAHMERSIRRMEILVDDLLNTSLLDTGMFALHIRRCDMVKLCHHILEEHIIGTDLTVTLTAPSGPIEEELDVDRIIQGLLNRLSNGRID